jgi:hypothetical protein
MRRSPVAHLRRRAAGSPRSARLRACLPSLQMCQWAKGGAKSPEPWGRGQRRLADIGHRLRRRRTVGAFRHLLSRKSRTRCDREWAPRVTAETQAALPLPMTKPSPLWAGATCSFRQLHRPFGGKVSRLPARSETQDLSCGRARARRVWGAAQRPPEVFTRRSGTVPN